MTNATRIIAGLFLFSCWIAKAMAVVQISALPFTANQSGETYVLANGVTQGAGDGLVVSASNVIIDGNNNTLTYCQTGVSSGNCAGINIVNASNVEIRNLTLQQGAYDIGSGQFGYAIRGSGNSLYIHDVTFNLIARRDADDIFGVKVNTSVPGSELTSCTFNVTGENRMKIHDTVDSSMWRVHENVVFVSNLKQPNPGRYSKLFYMGAASEYYGNTISVDAASEAVNIFVVWNRSKGKIYNNTINFASHHGRPILLDNGSANFEIYNNFFTITSQNSGADTTYVIRIRDDNGNAGSSNHWIHHNTIDASNSSQVNGVSLGNSSADSTGNKFYYNVIKSSGVPIEFYGNATSNTDFYCNQIIHTGTSGYPITVHNGAHTDTVFSNNIVSTNRSDGAKIFLDTDQSGTGQWQFCDSNVTSANVVGNAPLSDFAFRSAPCQDGANLCANNAGASLTPPIKPLPPANLMVQ
jgi:hypothetical protein